MAGEFFEKLILICPYDLYRGASRPVPLARSVPGDSGPEFW